MRAYPSVDSGRSMQAGQGGGRWRRPGRLGRRAHRNPSSSHGVSGRPYGRTASGKSGGNGTARTNDRSTNTQDAAATIGLVDHVSRVPLARDRTPGLRLRMRGRRPPGPPPLHGSGEGPDESESPDEEHARVAVPPPHENPKELAISEGAFPETPAGYGVCRSPLSSLVAGAGSAECYTAPTTYWTSFGGDLRISLPNGTRIRVSALRGFGTWSAATLTDGPVAIGGCT